MKCIEVQATHRIDAHAGECVHDGGAAEDEHGGHDDVGEDAEEEEHQVRNVAPARMHDF